MSSCSRSTGSALRRIRPHSRRLASAGFRIRTQTRGLAQFSGGDDTLRSVAGRGFAKERDRLIPSAQTLPGTAPGGNARRTSTARCFRRAARNKRPRLRSGRRSEVRRRALGRRRLEPAAFRRRLPRKRAAAGCGRRRLAFAPPGRQPYAIPSAEETGLEQAHHQPQQKAVASREVGNCGEEDRHDLRRTAWCARR